MCFSFKEAPKATVAQLAERRLPKPQVAGSNPVCRSKKVRATMVRPFVALVFVDISGQ